MPHQDIPDQLSVMALPGTILFPGVLLPLYIFEPRYREMLSRVLDGNRMFAIGMIHGNGTDESVYEIGGAGLVRACVQNPDGSSNLVLQGMQRIRFVDWIQVQPYRIARVVSLESTNPQAEESAKLAELLRNLYTDLVAQGYKMPAQLQTYLEQLNNPETLGDLLSSALISDPILRQNLLQELDVPLRLKGLISSLKEHLKNG